MDVGRTEAMSLDEIDRSFWDRSLATGPAARAVST